MKQYRNRNKKKKKSRSKPTSIHWVESHNESHYNEEVDAYAKIAASVLQQVSNNYNHCECPRVIKRNKKHSKCDCNWGENNFTSYDTIKSEMKYLSHKLQESQWNECKINNKNA